MNITVEDFKKLSNIKIDDATITKNIKRAKLMIDLLMPDIEEGKLVKKQKDMLETAIILQAEYLAFTGESSAIGGATSSFSIGSFSMGSGRSNESVNVNRYSPNAIDVLYSAGLLYERVRLI